MESKEFEGTRERIYMDPGHTSTGDTTEPMPVAWWLSIIACVILVGGAIGYQIFQIQASEIDHLRYLIHACELQGAVGD